MDIKDIQDLIRADSPRVLNIAHQQAYMEGKNVAILGRAAHESPDNRISIPIVRKAITVTSGYMAGDGAIKYSTKDLAKKTGVKGLVDKVKSAVVGKSDYFTDVLKPIFDANDETLTTHEEFETACAHGYVYEYHYTKDREARFVEVPPEQCIPIWDNSLPRNLVGFIRHYSETTIGSTEAKKVAIYYDNTGLVRYEGQDVESLVFAGDEVHGYGEVPWNVGKINRNGANLFDHVLSIIDFRDRIVSEDWANELQRFASSYLLLANRLSTEVDETGLNEVDKLRITRTFEDLGENVKNKVDFLIKTIPHEFIDKADQLFERLAYDMMMILDNKDISTTGQISGISLAYKLLPFEYACKVYEAYFSRFLQTRIRLIQNITGNMSAKLQDRPQISLEFTRNLPFNLEAAIEMFVKVSPGQLPIRTALKLLPSSIVPDVEEVAREMESERAIPNMDTPDDEATETDESQE